MHYNERVIATISKYIQICTKIIVFVVFII